MSQHSAISVYLPDCLGETAKVAASRRGYGSVSQYFQALLRLDILLGPDHTLPRKIGEMALEKRGKVDEELHREAERITAFVAPESGDLALIQKALAEVRTNQRNGRATKGGSQ